VTSNYDRVVTILPTVSITKSIFFLIFKRAWNKSFTTENIKSVFQKPEIWPVSPSDILQKVAIL
jgi:hypothetical protein